MKDGLTHSQRSAVQTVGALREGEAYCKAKFIPAYHVNPDLIRRHKHDLLKTLSSVVGRAKQLSFADYEIHGTHSFTANLDVVVAAVVVRVNREPEL